MIVFSVVLLSTLSCVKENLEDCTDPRGNVRVRASVTTDIAGTRAEIDGFEIDRAHLYVFDARGSYLTSAESDQVDETGRGYDFWLTLPDGDFDFVVWTNIGELYRVNKSVEESTPGSHTMSDMELWLDHGGQPLTDTIPHLLHGIIRSQTIVYDVENRVEIEITPKTYTVNLTALGLPEGSDLYAFTITDNNSHYTFQGELIENKPLFTHRRTDTAPRGEFRSSIRTLTLSADRDPRFGLVNTTTGTTLHDADLIYTITRAYRAASRAPDFENTYTYDIVLTFDTAKMEFTVSVNGWEHDRRYTILNR